MNNAAEQMTMNELAKENKAFFSWFLREYGNNHKDGAAYLYSCISKGGDNIVWDCFNAIYNDKKYPKTVLIETTNKIIETARQL